MSTQERLFGAPVVDHTWRPPERFPSLEGARAIGFDLETTGKNPWRDKAVGASIVIPVVWADPQTWKRYYLPWGHKGGGNLDEGAVKRWLKDKLAGLDLYNLNMKFDVSIGRNDGIELEAWGCHVHDVAFPPALLNENRRSGFSLRALAEEYLPEDERKVLQVAAAGYTAVPDGEIWLAHAGEIAPRAEQDAYLALRLKHVTDSMIDAEGLRRVLNLEDDCIYAVVEMERNGARIDRARAEAWRREVRAKHEEMILDLYRATKMRVNPDSGIEMKRFFDYLKLPYPMVRDNPRDPNSGLRASFEEDQLKNVDHPLVRQALLARKLKSLDSKFLTKIIKALDGDNVVRYHLHQLRGDEGGTVMGRFSSAAPSTGGINCQQVPKVDKQISDDFVPEWIIRELFIPDDGFLWCKADAMQIEYRVLAHYMENPAILRRYREDPYTSYHKIVHAMVLNIVPDFPYWALKNFNFGGVYGFGRDKAAEMLNVSRDKSDPLYDAYHAMKPELRQLQNRCADVAKKRGFVKTFIGRRRRYPTGERLHSALHAVISGTAAEINKMKLRDVYRERKTIGIHKLRMTVHDEMDGDVPDKQAAERWRDLLDQQLLELRVPILWEVKTGKNWRCQETGEE